MQKDVSTRWDKIGIFQLHLGLFCKYCAQAYLFKPDGSEHVVANLCVCYAVKRTAGMPIKIELNLAFRIIIKKPNYLLWQLGLGIHTKQLITRFLGIVVADTTFTLFDRAFQLTKFPV
jgi:hypothetical protein